jgi:hypothetical protein
MFIQQGTNQECVLTNTRSFAERPSLGKKTRLFRNLKKAGIVRE